MDALGRVRRPVARRIDRLLAGTRRARRLESGVALVVVAAAAAKAVRLLVVHAEHRRFGTTIPAARSSCRRSRPVPKPAVAVSDPFVARNEVELPVNFLRDRFGEVVVAKRRLLADLHEERLVESRRRCDRRISTCARTRPREQSDDVAGQRQDVFARVLEDAEVVAAAVVRIADPQGEAARTPSTWRLP